MKASDHGVATFTLATYVHLLDGDIGEPLTILGVSVVMRNDYRTPGEGVILYRAMTAPIKYLDAQELWDEKERVRRADVEAVRSGEKTEEQLKRETDAFAFPPSRARINLDSARSLS